MMKKFFPHEFRDVLALRLMEKLFEAMLEIQKFSETNKKQKLFHNTILSSI
jgi:hypothetical protein